MTNYSMQESAHRSERWHSNAPESRTVHAAASSSTSTRIQAPFSSFSQAILFLSGLFIFIVPLAHIIQ